MSISLIQAITLDEILKKQDAQIATLTAENERLRSAIQNWLAAIDEYREFLKKGRDVNSAAGVQYAIALDFREADLRAALQPKEGE